MPEELSIISEVSSHPLYYYLKKTIIFKGHLHLLPSVRISEENVFSGISGNIPYCHDALDMVSSADQLV